MERDTKQDLIIAALLALILHAALIPLRFSEVGISQVSGRLQGTITVDLVAKKPAAEVRVEENGLPQAQKKRPDGPVAKAPLKKKRAPELQSQLQPSKDKDNTLGNAAAIQPETSPKTIYQPESQAAKVLQETSPLPVDSREAAESFPTSAAGESERESVDSEGSTAGPASLQPRGQAGMSQGFTEAVAPRYGFRPDPRYPSFAVRRGYEGTVVLRVCVLKNGRVAEVRVKETSGYKILDESARGAVELWRFTPALLGGKPLDSWVLVPITFQLR